MNSLDRDIMTGEVIVFSKDVFPEENLFGRAMIVIVGQGMWKDRPGEKLTGHWASTGTRGEGIPGTCISVDETEHIQAAVGTYASYAEVAEWWADQKHCPHPPECVVTDAKGTHCRWCVEVDALEQAVADRDQNYQNLLLFIVDTLTDPIDEALRKYQLAFGSLADLLGAANEKD